VSCNEHIDKITCTCGMFQGVSVHLVRTELCHYKEIFIQVLHTFFSEFPPGKGKPPPKTGKKVKKTTRKDEMRRKREILKFYSGQEEMSSTRPYDFPLSSSSSNAQEVSPTTGHTELDEAPTGPEATDGTTVEQYERQHTIGFQPHIVFSSKKSGSQRDVSSPGYMEEGNSGRESESTSVSAIQGGVERGKSIQPRTVVA